MSVEQPFIPGTRLKEPRPLTRYLPILAANVINTWLIENVPKKSWLIDPFGASPNLAIEAARAGYRLIVVANNPISRFLIEFSANPPTVDELKAALAELAAARRGDERLEPHILSLYATKCDNCQKEVFADAYLWERDAEAPYARIYDCIHCDHSGEHPTIDEDIEIAARYSTKSLHHARALERIAPKGSQDRANADEALEVYPPRAVYALSTLINKFDGLSLPQRQKDLLSALLISACDRGNALWAHPSGRSRPRQLSLPRMYRENNIWFALEKAIAEWALPSAPIPTTQWPEEPPSEGGISIFEGKLKDFTESMAPIEISAIITTFPRPNQAFWSLSALWAGWLWGPEAIGPFISVIRRRRYDWAWHTNALKNTLSHLSPHISQGLPMFGLVTEDERGFNAAVMISADLAGFNLKNIALRPRAGQTQLLWLRGKTKPTINPEQAPKLAQEAAIRTLHNRGEPSDYLYLQSAALWTLIHKHNLKLPNLTPAEIYTEIQSILEFGFTFKSKITCFGGSETSLDSGHWWLKNIEHVSTPIADRVEVELVNHITNNPGRSFDELDSKVCSIFPGLLTPGEELVRVILESYAREDNEGGWKLRDVDAPQSRRNDIQEIIKFLTQIGKQFGFNVAGKHPLRWKKSKTIYNFFPIASSLIAEFTYHKHQVGDQNLIVLPGGRSRLILYKLKRDPRLKKVVEDNWQFVKFRQIRRLAENESLSLEKFSELITLDPLTIDQPQIPLL